MKRAALLLVAATSPVLGGQDYAAHLANDCKTFGPADMQVVTRDGSVGTLLACEPLTVKLKDGTVLTTPVAIPVLYPIPRDAPDWYGFALDPNWEPQGR